MAPRRLRVNAPELRNDYRRWDAISSIFISRGAKSSSDIGTWNGASPFEITTGEIRQLYNRLDIKRMNRIYQAASILKRLAKTAAGK